MSYAITDEQESPRITPAVGWLISINVAIYFLQLTIVNAGDMQRALGFAAGDLSTTWWKGLTYMFVHGNLLHVAGNMYMLYVFGPRVEQAWGTKPFAQYYLTCGVGAWLVYIMLIHGGLLIGASGALYGVMLAYVMRWPNDEIYFMGVVPMKVKFLLAGYVVYDLALGAGNLHGISTGTAHWAHIGGLLTGFVYLRLVASDGLERFRPRVAQVAEISDEPPRPVPRSLPRPREQRQEIDEIVAKSKAVVTRRPAAPPPVPKLAAPRKVDDLNLVLDKISATGLESLTLDERRLLEEMSKKLRNRD
jgi:membrane associated rhomboid family serine protease